MIYGSDFISILDTLCVCMWLGIFENVYKQNWYIFQCFCVVVFFVPRRKKSYWLRWLQPVCVCVCLLPKERLRYLFHSNWTGKQIRETEKRPTESKYAGIMPIRDELRDTRRQSELRKAPLARAHARRESYSEANRKRACVCVSSFRRECEGKRQRTREKNARTCKIVVCVCVCRSNWKYAAYNDRKITFIDERFRLICRWSGEQPGYSGRQRDTDRLVGEVLLLLLLAVFPMWNIFLDIFNCVCVRATITKPHLEVLMHSRCCGMCACVCVREREGKRDGASIQSSTLSK